jgi:hypothetical protein
MWVIWTIPNKMAIEKRFLGPSNEAFYKIFALLYKWCKLMKGGDVKFLENMVNKVKEWLQNFWQQTENMEIEGII